MKSTTVGSILEFTRLDLKPFHAYFQHTLDHKSYRFTVEASFICIRPCNTCFLYAKNLLILLRFLLHCFVIKWPSKWVMQIVLAEREREIVLKQVIVEINSHKYPKVNMKRNIWSLRGNTTTVVLVVWNCKSSFLLKINFINIIFWICFWNYL